MKRKFLLLLATGCFLLGMSATAVAAPLGNFGLENVQGHRSAPPYGWDFTYDISFESQDLIIDIDIHLTGDDSSALRDVWESGIETIWSTAFDISDGTYLYDTVFNVDWVDTAVESDFVVTALDEQGRSNMTTWYMDRPQGHQEELAAHEFGHMMGLFDEYTGGAVDPSTGLIRDSIMGNYYQDSSPFEDQYDAFRLWLEGMSGLDLTMLDDTGDHYYPTGTVPEPAAFLLLGTGLLGLGAIRKTIKKV